MSIGPVSLDRRSAVLLVVAFLLSVVTVPLAGGRLSALAELRISQPWLLLASLSVQVSVVSLWPDADPVLLAVGHVASYAFIVLFLLANRDMPGLWLVSVGTAMNLTAIVANGGVMPATRAALEAAGRLPTSEAFANSTIVQHAQLKFLGDVFAWPEPLPLANVFSAGDICIVIGAVMVVHQICGSRLAPPSRPRSSRRPLKPMRGERSPQV